MAIRAGTWQAMFGALVLIATVCEVSSLGCYHLTVELFQWSSNGKDSDGDSCDRYVPFISRRECDTIFYICVDNMQPRNWFNRYNTENLCQYTRLNCASGVCRTTDFHNKNGLTFPTGTGALGNNVPNPFVYKETRPWQKARLYVAIYDKDTGSDDDHIDNHTMSLNGLNMDFNGNKWAYPWSEDVLEHKYIYKISFGQHYSKTYSKLSVKYKAVCCENYYDYNCAVFCLAQDNPQEGHYTCDPKTGAKICLPEYKDNSTRPPCSTRSSYDPCSTFSCQNGGTHEPNYADKSCGCICPTGTTGHRCQTIIQDNCPAQSPCLNDGTCNSTDSGYLCTCKSGFTGEKCQYSICNTANFCKNGGECIMKGTVRGCICPKPFDGIDCSMCDCSNHGTCNVTGGYCTCYPGWDGLECNVEICKYKDCLNGGKCIAGRCQCMQGYTGKICEYELGACGSNPCLNNATCFPRGNGVFTCECTVISTGDLCEKLISIDDQLTEEPDSAPVLDPEIDPEEKTKGGLAIWVYVIIVLVVLILIIVLLVALLWRQKRKRRQAEAQTEHAVRNGGLKNFDNPLYGNDSRAAQTDTAVNGVAVGTQVYDTPKSKKGFNLFGGNKKEPIDDENPYDMVGGAVGGNVYDVPPKKGDNPPPLPKRSTERQRGQFDNPSYETEDGGRRDKPPAYLAGVPPAYSEQPPSPIKVVPVDFVEPASPKEEDDEQDPAKLKKKLANKYSKA